MSIVLRRITAPMPKMSLISTMPMPRSSMKSRTISGDSPRSLCPTRAMSTTSSATSRWPRLISSSAHSLLPTPLSPVISTPTPNTSTSTPCCVTRGASTSARYVMALLVNALVSAFVR